MGRSLLGTRYSIGLFVCLIVCACGGGGATPTAPTPTPTPTPAATPTSPVPNPTPTPSVATNVGGKVLDTGNSPISSATVQVISPTADQGNATTTDAQGIYRLSGIKSSTFTVRYSHANFDSLEREYTLQLGTERTDLDTRLTRKQIGPSPATQSGLTIQIGTGVATSERNAAESSFRVAQTAIRGIYGQAPENVFVAIYLDIEEMLNVYLPFMGLPESQRDQWRETLRRFPSFSGYRAIWRGLWTGSRWTQDTWTHESTHVLQWELSQNASGGRAARWIEEGHATHVEYRVGRNFNTEQWRSLVRNAGISYRLSEIEGDRIFDLPNAYNLAGLGAEYLKLQYGGDAAMMKFWTELARSPWQTAFQSAFGVTPAVFYEAFERFR